ncbi:hypothetical protein LAZ67_3006087, partial [Cordylochernes scorpioides]
MIGQTHNQVPQDSTTDSTVAASLRALTLCLDQPLNRDPEEAITYDGDEPAAHFFSQLESQPNFQNLEPARQARKALSSLRGEPRKIAQELALLNKTYEEVKESLCAVYPRRPSFTLQAFYELKCTSMAEIETYYKNKVRIGLAINLPKSAIVQALSNGVPRHYGNLLKMAQPSEPEEWLCLAQLLAYEGDNTSTKAVQQRSPRQSREPSTTVDKTPPYPCRYCGGQHWHAQCQQRGPYQRTFRTFTPVVHNVEQHQKSTRPAGVYETSATTTREKPSNANFGSRTPPKLNEPTCTLNQHTPVMQFGSPKRLLTDRAPAFTSPKFRRFLIRHNIGQLLTTSNNPQANGLSERLNATITGKLKLLRLQQPKTAWTKLLPQVLQAYNNTPHSVTGFPPSYLLLGSFPLQLSEHVQNYPKIDDARELAYQRTHERHLRDKARFNQTHRASDFEVGDLVLAKTYHHPDTGKLAPFFSGPYEILEIISPQIVRINRSNRPLSRETDTIHVNNLKHYTENEQFISPPEEPLEERRNMNLPFELIPRYDPDEGLSYDNWSRLFDHQAQQQGLSSKESLSMMPMLFKGKALEMYALICRDISSLEELHSRMKRFFHEPEHGLHRKFWQVRKGREQSVKEYYFAKIKLATKLGLSQELILEGLTSGIESEFERFLIAASPTSLERWLEIAEAIEISHCRTTSSASGMEMGYPARRRPSTSWQGGQGYRPRNWREGRNDRPGTHLPPTRSQTASLAAVQDHEDSGAVPYVLKSKPVYQPDAKPLPLPDTNDCFLHDNIELFTMVKILLDNHAEIFGENKFNIKPLNIQPPRLRLSDKKPVCVRPYRHSLRDRDLINQQIEQLLKYGLIKPASSPYSAPVTLAPKKGEGRVRLCIDYRLLNRKIISDSFPIPLMEDIVQKVQGARVFSCLDILSAYWTIPLHPKDREMTCFSTSEGSYVWCRLPFGLKTAPAIFNRKLSAILQKYKLDNVTSYFDDILVFSENEESHLKHLGQIFEILRKEGIQLRRDKCLLFMKRITYLGYEISENQISPSGVNVDVIKSLPPPRDLRCLRSFLGSVTHYAKFINNFNNLRAPLNELLKKNSRFIWTEECQRSFEGLKEALCSKPILQLFNPSLATHIYCDASTSGIGAVLKQEYPDGTQKPFTYFSRALRGAESKYTITELELLAVVETCKRYHPYISGSHVIVHTDHKALIWLNSFKHTNGRLFRWSLKLSEYDLDFNYNKGCENHEADMLSRLPYSYFLSAQALKQNQGDLSIPPSKLYSIVDGITYIRLNNKDRVVVPPELQDDLIQKAHESLGHPGISAMIRALSVQYYFKGMIGKIKNYVKNCKECQTIKSSTQPSYGLMGSLPRAAKPFDVVALDTVLGLGGYNSAKNCAHTVIDHHSRYIWGYASKGTSIATYINIINQLLNIGKPRILVTDRHPSFVSKRFNKFLQEKGIKHVMTSPSHPECNGLVERANATLIGRLKIQHQGNPRAPWPKLLQKTLEEYRDTPHSTTTFPPIYLLYGTLPSYMSDLTNPYPPVERARTIANEKTEELHKRLVKRYNSSHRFPNLKIGDKVLYRIPHQVGHGKLSPVYYPDPYTVLSTPSPHTVEINKPCQPENKPSTIVNVSKLKLWDPISTSNEGRRNYPFPFQDVEDLNGFSWKADPHRGEEEAEDPGVGHQALPPDPLAAAPLP